MLYNPLKKEIKRKINLPVYYTGLTVSADISINGEQKETYYIKRDYSIDYEVIIPAEGYIWLLIE